MEENFLVLPWDFFVHIWMWVAMGGLCEFSGKKKKQKRWGFLKHFCTCGGMANFFSFLRMAARQRQDFPWLFRLHEGLGNVRKLHRQFFGDFDLTHKERFLFISDTIVSRQCISWHYQLIHSHHSKELMWDKSPLSLRMKKSCRMWGVPKSHFLLSLRAFALLSASLTHMARCALIRCRYSLAVRVVFRSFRFFSTCGWRESFFFIFPLQWGFHFFATFLRCSHGRLWSFGTKGGVGNDWWIRERNFLLLHEEDSSLLASSYRSMNRRPSAFEISEEIFCIKSEKRRKWKAPAIFFPIQPKSDDC